MRKNSIIKFTNLIKEWDYEKNQILPEEVGRGSHKTIWWKCEKGHEWEALVKDRVKGNNCPYCSNRKVCKDNCLSTTHPELLKEWDYEKNNITERVIKKALTFKLGMN